MLLSEHSTLAEAYAELDRLAERVYATGATLNGIEWLVADADGNLIERPLVH
jgi:hypothetical protein